MMPVGSRGIKDTGFPPAFDFFSVHLLAVEALIERCNGTGGGFNPASNPGLAGRLGRLCIFKPIVGLSTPENGQSSIRLINFAANSAGS